VIGFPTIAYFLAVDFTSGRYLLAFLLILMSALLIAIFLSLRHTAQDGNHTISAGSFLLHQDNPMG
jgi:hypothetical protein